MASTTFTRFMSMPECCEHMLYHWVMMPYQCQHCPHEFYTIYDLKHHHKIEHPDAKLYTDPKGPTLSRAIQCIENPKKRPFTKFAQSLASKKKPRLDDSPKDPKRKKEEITSGIVINAPKGKRPQKPSPAMTDAVITLDDDEDDLVIVSKTDDRVPNEDNVFACDICAFLCESEIFILKHLAQEHGVRTNKFHILSKKLEESETALEMACNICNEVFSELKLRKHFIQNHFTGQTYAPYRYKCLLCPGKFLTVSRLKVHFTRAHPDEVISYQCIIPSMKVPILSTKVPKQVATHKQYFCTFCSYSTVSTTTVTIRGHLKAHLKPILCTKCNARFRYHKEVVTHCANNHPEQIGAQYVTLDDVMSEFSETMKLIIERAVVTSADNIDAPLKSIAKKSTSARFPGSKSDEDEPGKELDLSKIRTTFELDQLEYTTTAEQMQKMFNMDTYVDLSDCTVDIMPLDNS